MRCMNNTVKILLQGKNSEVLNKTRKLLLEQLAKHGIEVQLESKLEKKDEVKENAFSVL